MRYRLLGQTGLRVSELFLGTQAFGAPPRGPADDPRRLLDAYSGAGGNFVDTSSSYGDGESERVVGQLLQGRRDRFVLATKYGWTRDGGDPNGGGNHRKILRSSLEASLRRLRTDHVDLLWVLLWDRHTPVEETMRALDDVVRAGKVLYVGFSDAPAWVVARANVLAEWRGWAPFAAIRVPYDLLNRDIERNLLPMAEALGLSVATWGPLAHRALSGQHTRPRGAAAHQPDAARARAALGEREWATAQVLQEVADELRATPAQVALAWTRARSGAVHPIVIPATAAQLEESLGIVHLALPGEALARLDAVSGFTRGFPADFIAEAIPWVLGEVASQVDGR